MTAGSWSVAVFSSREEPSILQAAIEGLIAADHHGLRIDVLVNGRQTLAEQMAERLASGTIEGRGCELRLWFIPLGDKAHAINEYLHGIWERSELAFLVDGYVRVNPDALRKLAVALESHREALVGSGVPTRSLGSRKLARKMIREGGIHGNLYALKSHTIQRIRETAFRLPLGIYRTDPTLGAALAFDLAPDRESWEPRRRLVVVPESSWTVLGRSWWHPLAIKAWFQRRQRQAQGSLENHAVANHFANRRRSVGSVPDTVSELVAAWASECPEEFRRVTARRRYRKAWQRLSVRRDWSLASEAPRLLYRSQ